jgi:hypothetical protein
MLTIVNTTPHEIVVLEEEGVETNEKGLLVSTPETMKVRMKIPPSDIVVRVTTKVQQMGNIATQLGSIPIQKTVYGEVEGLPEETGDVWYIVSGLVANAVKNHRGDCLSPGSQVRDRNKPDRTLGCLSIEFPTK